MKNKRKHHQKPENSSSPQKSKNCNTKILLNDASL